MESYKFKKIVGPAISSSTLTSRECSKKKEKKNR